MHRSHLFSLRIGDAFRQSCIEQPYTRERLWHDVMAGITVGIIAIPLAMALAIASGVEPQYGLYTAIIAGFIVALTGGSRLSISGPTAAFVVILFPVAHKYGISGLLLATFMAGILLVSMAFMRLGRYIEYVSGPVTMGFTVGIAIVIVVLQINDFMGLGITTMPEHFHAKIKILSSQMIYFNMPTFSVAMLTLAIMIIWPRLKTPIPPHLPAVLVAATLAYYLNGHGHDIATIGSRFSYLFEDGSFFERITSFVPTFEWPWHRPGPDGERLVINLQLFRELLPIAFAIAMLGAIESLLCAVVMDNMTGRRHSSNSELLGQGIGNIVAPLFGGITATAAIARSAANYKAGATSPVAGMVHALFVLAALLLFTPALAYLPMASMAALLMVAAWNMSEAPKAIHMMRTAPIEDVLVFLKCLFLTVFFDMVIAITVGVLMSAVFFMKQVSELTKVTDISDDPHYVHGKLPLGFKVFKINGPLFFAAADRVFGELASRTEDTKCLILYMGDVTMLDAGGLSALTKLIQQCKEQGQKIVLSDLQYGPLKTLARAKIKPVDGVSYYFSKLDEAITESTAMQTA